MSPLQRQELSYRIKGLDEEEKREALKLFPTHMILEEFHRRGEAVENLYQRIEEVFRNSASTGDIAGKEKAIQELQNIFKI